MRTYHSTKKRRVGTIHTFAYRCAASARDRQYECPTLVKSIKLDLANESIGNWLIKYHLGESWQTEMEELLQQDISVDTRKSIEQQLKRLTRQRENRKIEADEGLIYGDAYREALRAITSEETRLRQLLADQPTEAMISAGRQLATVPECWELARCHDAYGDLRELAQTLFHFVVWNLETSTIVGCKPPQSFRLALSY
jgi:hypothetical protein